MEQSAKALLRDSAKENSRNHRLYLGVVGYVATNCKCCMTLRSQFFGSGKYGFLLSICQYHRSP